MALYQVDESICYKVLPFIFNCHNSRELSTEVAAVRSAPSLVLVQ